MRVRSSLVPAAVAAGVVLTLAGCGKHQPAVVYGSGSGPAPTATATATAAAFKPVLLTATDLGAGWKSAPAGAPSGDWLSGCSQGTGVAALQKPGAAQASFSGPGGVRVTTRIAQYAPGAAETAASGTDTYFSSCGIADAGSSESTWSALNAAGDSTAHGGEITTTDASGLTTHTSVYWLTVSQNSTIEVLVDGLMDESGVNDPMVSYAHQVLTAAVQKATTGKTSALPAPELPTPSTSGAGHSSGNTGTGNTGTGNTGTGTGTTGTGTGDGTTGTGGSGGTGGGTVGTGGNPDNPSVPALPSGVAGEVGPG